MIAVSPRRALGSLCTNTTPTASPLGAPKHAAPKAKTPLAKGKSPLAHPKMGNTPKSKPAQTPKSKPISKDPTISQTDTTSPELIEAFGEIGILQDVRGPAPPTCEIFDEMGVLQGRPGQPPAEDEEWDESWEWNETWNEGWGDVWNEDWKTASRNAEPTVPVNTHIRFSSSPEPAPVVRHPKLRTLKKMGAMARALRGHARADGIAVPSIEPSEHDLIAADPVPVLSAAASVLHRKMREAEECRALAMEYEERAEAMQYEWRAEEVRARHQTLASPQSPPASHTSDALALPSTPRALPSRVVADASADVCRGRDAGAPAHASTYAS
jgi:hypothetical protein